MFIFAHPVLYTMIRSYTKKTFSFILALVVSSLTAMGQNAIDGTWHGELEISGQKLMLVFHLDPEGSSIDSPDQMAYNIPADIMESSPTKVKVEIPSLNAGFEGSMMFGLLIGKFRQNGLEFPLSLKHGNPEMKRPQTPAPPFAYQNEDVTFTNPYDGALLSGTLAIPQDHSHDTPVILLVSGSGLQNRDEEIFGHKPFAVIADHFAENGIATLRYDDRSVGRSTGDVSKATTETFRQDAKAGLEYLKTRKEFGKTGILGHSEGGTIAFLLAGEGGPDFIISLAGGAVSGAEILAAQNEVLMITGGIPEELVNRYCRALKEVLTDSAMTAGKLDVLSAGLPEWMRKNLHAILDGHDPWTDHFAGLDPAESISRIQCPVMALNGEMDMQVISDKNLEVLRNLLQPSDKNMIKAYPGLNHLFQHCRTGRPEEYQRIEETISDEVLNDIVNWIKRLER